MKHSFLVSLICLGLVSLLYAQSGIAPPLSSPVVPTAPPSEKISYETGIAPLLKKYCTNCHGGDSPKNDLSLEFADARDIQQRLLKDRKVFERVAERVRLGEMPPSRRAKPTEQEKKGLITWIDRDVLRIEGHGQRDPGQVARVRRLTRV